MQYLPTIRALTFLEPNFIEVIEGVLATFVSDPRPVTVEGELVLNDFGTLLRLKIAFRCDDRGTCTNEAKNERMKDDPPFTHTHTHTHIYIYIHGLGLGQGQRLFLSLSLIL